MPQHHEKLRVALEEYATLLDHEEARLKQLGEMLNGSNLEPIEARLQSIEAARNWLNKARATFILSEPTRH